MGKVKVRGALAVGEAFDADIADGVADAEVGEVEAFVMAVDCADCVEFAAAEQPAKANAEAPANTERRLKELLISTANILTPWPP